jgi:predicted RNase H-like HicB family nuclease
MGLNANFGHRLNASKLHHEFLGSKYSSDFYSKLMIPIWYHYIMPPSIRNRQSHTRVQTMKPSDRYLKIVEWSEEDQCYVGSCPGLFHGGVHGPEESKVYSDLCNLVEEWITDAVSSGEPLPVPTAGRDYSGNFMLRVGKELHKSLTIRAMQQGQSLNKYCARVLKRSVKKRNRTVRTKA